MVVVGFAAAVAAAVAAAAVVVGYSASRVLRSSRGGLRMSGSVINTCHD